VRFNFPNINLPDSTNNEPESHGYIQYKIKRNAGLSPGTAISNKASIYFDFNAPIVTNTVTNNICTAVNQDVYATICQGQPYYFKNQWLSASGNYTDTLRFLNQCDSIRTLHLTVLPANSSTLQQQICEGSSYSFYGQTLSTSGAYQHILQTQNGCDSVVMLQLQVLPATDSVVVATIVQGQTYTLPGGVVVSIAGLYADTLLNSEGCDSIVNTQLSVVSGIENETMLFGFSIYPNPTSGIFIVDVSKEIVGETLIISDITGRVVYQSDIPLGSAETKSEISIASAGVYFVRIGSSVKRVVVR
jgi:hypothetical protein